MLRRRREPPDIPTSSMADVAMLLVAFFVLTAEAGLRSFDRRYSDAAVAEHFGDGVGGGEGADDLYHALLSA